MLWHVYVRKGIAIVPVVAKTTAGFYVECEPVQLASMESPGDVERAIVAGMTRGNPMVPTPPREAVPVVLKYAGVATSRSFERNADIWMIERDGAYRISKGVRRADGGWDENWADAVSGPESTDVHGVARRVVDLMLADRGNAT